MRYATVSLLFAATSCLAAPSHEYARVVFYVDAAGDVQRDVPDTWYGLEDCLGAPIPLEAGDVIGVSCALVVDVEE